MLVSSKKCSVKTCDGGVPGASPWAIHQKLEPPGFAQHFVLQELLNLQVSHECERLSSDCSLFLQKKLAPSAFFVVFSFNKKGVGWGWVGGNNREGKPR